MATRKSLVREIEALSDALGISRKAQMYQDEDEVEEVMQEIDEFLDEEDYEDEVELDDLEDEVELDEEDFDDEVDEFAQEDDDEISQDVEELLQALEEDDDVPVMASEMEEGIEDEINQDYLDDVVELRDKEDLATDDTMLDTAPTDYKAMMKKASARLDRVATYFEKTGRSKLAYRIDCIADSIDAQL